jgi:hypothetical protein
MKNTLKEKYLKLIELIKDVTDLKALKYQICTTLH